MARFHIVLVSSLSDHGINIFWPSPPGTFHILIGKFSYFVIRFLDHIFLSLTFPISLSEFYLRGYDCILGEVSGTVFKNQLFMLYGVETS